MRLPYQLLASFAALCASVVLHVDSARACSEPLCSPPVRLFGVDAYVPGNLVYFKLRASDPGPLSLETASGTKIPASIRKVGPDLVFAPDAPIPDDTQVRLRYVALCRGVPSDTAQSYEFRTTSPADITGLSVSAPEEIERGFSRSSPFDNERAFVRLANPVPWGIAHLVDSLVKVDDRWAAFDDADHTRLTVTSFCDAAHDDGPDSCGTHRSFSAGKHTVVVSHTIVGDLLVLAPGTTQVDLACEGARRGTAVPD